MDHRHSPTQQESWRQKQRSSDTTHVDALETAWRSQMLEGLFHTVFANETIVVLSSYLQLEVSDRWLA